MPEADRGVLDPGLGQRPVGEPDHLAVGDAARSRRAARRPPGGTRGAGRDAGSRSGRPARRGSPARARPAARPRRCRRGRSPRSARDGGRRPPGPCPSGQLEELGHDPRAALALVQLGELQHGRPRAARSPPARTGRAAALRARRAGRIRRAASRACPARRRSAAPRRGQGLRVSLLIRPSPRSPAARRSPGSPARPRGSPSPPAGWRGCGG